MDKISTPKKNFFKSIELDINKIPSEQKIKALYMPKSMSDETAQFMTTDGLASVRHDMFCLKTLFGTSIPKYDDKTWIEIFIDQQDCDEIIELATDNVNKFFKEMHKPNNDSIELYEFDGKYYAKDGVGVISILMLSYLQEMSNASTKDEKNDINQKYTFYANIYSLPEDNDIIYLTNFLSYIYGNKLVFKNLGDKKECKYNIKYGNKAVLINSKKELKSFVKNNYFAKQYKDIEKLKVKVRGLADLGIQYKNSEEINEFNKAFVNIFPKFNIFVDCYQNIKDWDLEEKLFEQIDLSTVTYEIIYNKMVKLVKQEGVNKKVAKAKKSVAEETSIAKDNEKKKNPESLKQNIDDKMNSIKNSVEMMYYKFKTEESNVFELASDSKVVLNIDRINDDSVSSYLNSIKSNQLELKNKLNNEEDVTKLNNIYNYVDTLNHNGFNKNIINEYVDEMHRIYGNCLNKYTQKVITDSKLDKLEYQREEIENERCSLFSKIIGKAKLKQARLDNISLKKQLILSESQYADKLHYYIEDGLSDLYAYIKNEEDERCLSEAKSYIRMIESNMKLQNLIDNDRLNKLIKEKVAQKKNLPQIILSKEKKKLFSKAQINLMEEKNNELKRVIQITRANSLKQQNTGMIPILGNIKTTKSFNKFCNDVNKIDGSIRSLI